MKVFVLLCNDDDEGIEPDYMELQGVYKSKEKAIQEACLLQDCENISELCDKFYNIIECDLQEWAMRRKILIIILSAILSILFLIPTLGVLNFCLI